MFFAMGHERAPQTATRIAKISPTISNVAQAANEHDPRLSIKVSSLVDSNILLPRPASCKGAYSIRSKRLGSRQPSEGRGWLAQA
jgi:hypothetical protein